MKTHVQQLFLEIADLDALARSRYFEEHEISADVRLEVESLLRFDGGGVETLTNVIGPTLEEFLGSVDSQSCGPYELVGLLGQGGMGSVYRGRRKDREVDIQVAVKLIRGAHANQSFVERFLRERQILASLNHPGITRLLDAGHTQSGQPYFVMEYVDGLPIDVYCRNLSLQSTLKLFVSVCEAIAYLHRNLVIHRDLKPSNILVEPDGSPKILDFGISKILDETAAPDVTRERMLTPEYASPEQVKGKAKTTATDVYSLGAVLYGLLAGRSPHTTDDSGKTIEEVICSVEPVPLQTLCPSVSRDLSLVIRKALRKEPLERYPSVDAFADDLRAILDSRPVKVRSGDTWYTARKFARRHWLPLSALTAAILSLSAGLYVASRARMIEQRRFTDLRRLSTQVLALDGDVRELAGSTKAREKIVSVSMEYLDGLGREARNDLDLKLEVANGYMVMAEVQGVPVLPSLGHFKEAETSLAKASALIDSVLVTKPNRADALLLGAEVAQDRMIVADTMKDHPAALQLAGRSAEYGDRLLKVSGVTLDQRKRLARIYIHIGQAQMNGHEYQAASVQMNHGIEIARASGADPALIAQGLSALANARRQTGDLEGALSAATEARAIGETVQFSREDLRASAMYAILWRQGLILGADESVSLNRPEEAVEPFQKAFDLVDKQASKDANDVSFRERVGTAGQELGDVLRHTDPERALAVYDRTLLRLREARTSSSAQQQEARVLAHSSAVLRRLHRNQEAKKQIDLAMEILRSLGEEASAVGVIGGAWDHVLRASADYEAETGRPDRARHILLDLQTQLLALHPNLEADLIYANDMSRLYASIARLDAKLGKTDEAAMFRSKQTDLWQQWDRRLPNNSYVRRQIESISQEARSPSAR